MKKTTVNLLGAAALFAAGVALLRQGSQRPDTDQGKPEQTQDDNAPRQVRLERLRELGI